MRNHDSSHIEAADAGQAARMHLLGRDILAATLLTLAAVAFIGVAWKSSAVPEASRNARPSTEISQSYGQD